MEARANAFGLPSTLSGMLHDLPDAAGHLVTVARARRYGTEAQALRYVVAGGLANALALFCYYVATSTGLTPQLALLIMNGLGFAISFELNRRYTFIAALSLRGMFLFGATYAGSMLGQSLIMLAGTRELHLPHQLVVMIGLAAMSATSFVIQKHIVFRPSIKAESAAITGPSENA